MDIKRILKEIEVDDSHILLGEGKEVEFYGRKITIKQVNFIHDWDKFAYYMGLFLQIYSAFGEAFKLPDGLSDLEAFRKNIRIVMGNSQYGKSAIKTICKILKIYKAPVRFFKKMFSIDDWTELFLWVYLYNIIGVKKNLLAVSKLIRKLSS